MSKYLPRMIHESEKPHKTRSRDVESARNELIKNNVRLTELVKKLEPVAAKHNTKIDENVSKQLIDAANKAKKKGFMLSFSERKKIEVIGSMNYRNPTKEAYYSLLQEFRTKIGGTADPDIDQISFFNISPGDCIILYGTSFGPSQGKVFLKISADHIVELEVYTWSETMISAVLNTIIADVPLRPFYGEIWMQTAGGQTSNAWPIMYKPKICDYWASYTKRLAGGFWGNTDDKTFLKGKVLGDPDFEIVEVTKSHSGNGHSELHSPNASGQSLGQGYHIGVSATGHAHMTIIYRVSGPTAINPPFISELGPWVRFE